MLILPLPEFERMRAHLESGYPLEACGALLGHIDLAGRKIVERALPLKNAWDNEDAQVNRGNRYLIGPSDLAEAKREARRGGQVIVGFFHSHPDNPSRPSEIDRAHAQPVLSLVITSVSGLPAHGVAGATQSWVLPLAGDGLIEEPIVIRGG